MSAFADSSAIAKLYLLEAGSEAMKSLAGPLVVCELTRVEVQSALWRKNRTGELSARDAGILAREFAADWFAAAPADRFTIIGIGPLILEEACRLLAAHGLRAYDAVQLSTALAARRAHPECDEFACFDARLSAAAAAQGFKTIGTHLSS